MREEGGTLGHFAYRSSRTSVPEGNGKTTFGGRIMSAVLQVCFLSLLVARRDEIDHAPIEPMDIGVESRSRDVADVSAAGRDV